MDSMNLKWIHMYLYGHVHSFLIRFTWMCNDMQSYLFINDPDELNDDQSACHAPTYTHRQ